MNKSNSPRYSAFSTNLEQKISGYKSKVDDFIAGQIAETAPELRSIVSYTLEGGKRARPILLLLCWESVGGRDGNPLPAAMAVELIHAESLLQDDIIDDDNLRRGRPAFHVVHEDKIALLSIDLAFSITMDLISNYNDQRIIKVLSKAAYQMVKGELQDFNLNHSKSKISLKEYLQILSTKTGVLFAAAAKVGAIIGGGDNREAKYLSIYGQNLGLTYQLKDDISDMDKKEPNQLINHINCGCNVKHTLSEICEKKITTAKRSLLHLKNNQAREILIEFTEKIEPHPNG